ncbi:MAG: SDR family oxidoreductase [Deltaproteobacteria bacterium]|nr:MAG: SDR family oxidoreductase [Deltaproteobacteria bacterium]
MKGKIVLVTGATSGIGKVAAGELRRMGARVVALGRDPAKLAALEGMETLQCDLASLADIRRAAFEFKLRYKALHVLLNNAGSIFHKRLLSKDGYEMTFAVNHLAYFLLAQELLDLLRTSAPSRIVNVASEASRPRPGMVDLADLQNTRWRGGRDGLRAYARSKRENLLFSFELARRLEGTGVTVNAVHPGPVKTGFAMQAGWLGAVWRLIGPFLLTPEQGAQTLIWACSAPELEGVTGKYFYKKREIRAVPQAYDRELQKALWNASEKLVNQPSPASQTRAHP